MNPNPCSFGKDHRALFATLGAFAFVALHSVATLAQPPSTVDALPSWNDGAAKQAIVNFVKATTDTSSPDFVPPLVAGGVAKRGDGPCRPWSKPSRNWLAEPFKTVLSGDREAMAKLTTHDLEKILAATLTGMTVDTFEAEAEKWTEEAKDGRWKRPYTELTYKPMQEVLSYLHL